IIHLDGALARPPKFAHYNSGNVPYELQICSNTVVSSLVLVGYVKTKFGAVHHNKFNKLIGCGSLTDGEFKLQVYIINFKEDEYDKFDLNKGDKMEAIGVMQTAEPPYFLIQNLRDIKRVDGCLPLETVIKVSRSLKKRCSEGNSVQLIDEI
ncbi:Run domain beclin-1 interacting and cystein-rich containing, partial [Temnothorax longispinosus]